MAMVALFGTMAADGVHLIGLPYALTTAFYLLVVGVLFAVVIALLAGYLTVRRTDIQKPERT